MIRSVSFQQTQACRLLAVENNSVSSMMKNEPTPCRWSHLQLFFFNREIFMPL